MAESDGDIQRAVDEINEVLGTSETKINSAKTKIFDHAPENKSRRIYVDSQKLEQVDEMVYSGSEIASDGKSIRETKQRIAFVKNINCSL